MWESWGQRIEEWAGVKRIADRAVGSVVGDITADVAAAKRDKAALDPTFVPWSVVQQAWAAQRASKELRKSWMRETSGKTTTLEKEDAEELGRAEREAAAVDEVVERVKQDPELDQHEQRLLSCIVDSGMLSPHHGLTNVS